MRKMILLTPETNSKNTLVIEAHGHAGTLVVKDGRRFSEENASGAMWRHFDERFIHEIAHPSAGYDLLVVIAAEFLRASVLHRQAPGLAKHWPQLIRSTRSVAVTQDGQPGSFYGAIKRDRALLSLVGLLAQKRFRVDPGVPLADDIRAQVGKIAQRREDDKPEDLTLMIAYAATWTEHDSRPGGGLGRLMAMRFE